METNIKINPNNNQERNAVTFENGSAEIKINDKQLVDGILQYIKEYDNKSLSSKDMSNREIMMDGILSYIAKFTGQSEVSLS